MPEYYQIKNMYPLLKNPQKYLSENTVITARSGWEIKFIMKFLDSRTDVIGWTSEDFYIPYYSPIDNKMHRYFPDFLVKFKTKDGTIVERIIEIKPYIETQPPTIPKTKKGSHSYKMKCNIFIKNKCKWEAATKFCEEQRKKGRELFFNIITEKDFNFEGY